MAIIRNVRPIRSHPKVGRVPDWRWRNCSFAALNKWPELGMRDWALGADGTRAGALATPPHRQLYGIEALDYTTAQTGILFTFPSHANLQCAGAWTIAAWLYADSVNSSFQGILGKGLNSESAGSNHNYFLLRDLGVVGSFNDDQGGSGWVVGFERSDSAGANVTCKFADGGLVAGLYMVMGCLDVRAGELRLYVNGIKQRTRTTAFTGEVNTAGLVVGRINQDADAADLRWDGLISAAWVWKDRAFTDSEAYRFAQDPLGMFRTAESLGIEVGAAPGGSGARSFVAGMIG